MKDDTLPENKWEFNENVTNCFDDMLSRSIPQYDVMRQLVFDLGCELVSNFKNKAILDIGCSNGLSLEPFINKFKDNGRYYGLDVSEPMLTKARERFNTFINQGIVAISNCDLRSDFPVGRYNLVMSILTIQFTPIEYRQQIIQSIYDSLEIGGAFIMVEKVLGENHQMNKMFTDRYLKMKADNGYTNDQILRKKESLEGVLVPVTSKWNKELLSQAGFKVVDTFWRCLNFEGYIAIK